MIKTKQETMRIVQETNYSQSHSAVLDRTKPSERSRVLKTFSAEVEKNIGSFQDSDVILLALTVDHKKK
jgi:hypothetical protein